MKRVFFRNLLLLSTAGVAFVCFLPYFSAAQSGDAQENSVAPPRPRDTYDLIVDDEEYLIETLSQELIPTPLAQPAEPQNDDALLKKEEGKNSPQDKEGKPSKKPAKETPEATEEILSEEEFLHCGESGPVYQDIWSHIFDAEWSWGLDLGLDGNTGRTDTSAVWLRGRVKRKAKTNDISLAFDYNRKQFEERDLVEKFTFNYDFKGFFDEKTKVVSAFIDGSVYHNNERPYLAEIANKAGFGYKPFQEDDFKLEFQLGGGYSQKLGWPATVLPEDRSDEVIPEGSMGMSIKNKFLNKKLTTSIGCDYYPEMTDFNYFRIVSKSTISYTIHKVDKTEIMLKLHANYRFDNHLEDHDDWNDLSYGAMLGLEF